MKKQAGFTLIELMISLLLGLIIIAITVGIYVTTIRGSTDTINAARLNYDLESAMSVMVNDIRRAGYWGGAVTGIDSATNPFTTGTADIQIPTASCILYAYDTDGDGAPDNGEYYGFKLQNGAIGMRSDNTADTSGDCTGTGWRIMTVPESVNVTGLTFSPAYKCLLPKASYDNTACAPVATTGQKVTESRQIDITLTGQLVNDTTVTKTLTGSVKVRNNHIFTQP